MKQDDVMTKLKAIRKLRMHDHHFLSPERVKELGKPFEVFEVEIAQDNRSEVKGLELNDAKEGDITVGLSAHRLAELIADKFDLGYPRKSGRGSRLRAACDAVEKYLLASKKPRSPRHFIEFVPQGEFVVTKNTVPDHLITYVLNDLIKQGLLFVYNRATDEMFCDDNVDRVEYNGEAIQITLSEMS